MPSLREKVKRLTTILAQYKKVICALSGGVDSTLLLKFAIDTLGKEQVLAVTFVSPTYSISEIKEVQRIIKTLKPNHLFLLTDELSDKNFVRNSPQRCYFCKRSAYQTLLAIKEKYKFSAIIEGTNADDVKDYRPGRKAIRELNIKSPLLAAGLNKTDIRTLARRFSLPNRDKPPNPCLASRIPFFQKITEEELARVEKGEAILKRCGLSLFRLRSEVKTARIETKEEEMARILAKRKVIVKELKGLGYRYITLDLEGYLPSGLRWKRN